MEEKGEISEELCAETVSAPAQPITEAEETPAAVPTKKKRGPWHESLPVVFILTIALEEVGALLGGVIVGLYVGIYLAIALFSNEALLESLTDSATLLQAFPPVLETVVQYLPTIGVWGVCLLWFLRKNDRPLYRTFTPYCRGNTVPMLLLGLAMGAVMNGGCILAAYCHGDIALTYDSFRPGALLAVLLCVFVQSSSEELVCRGYLYQKLYKRFHKPAIAILGNALLFALLHVFNPGVTLLAILDIFIFGVLCSLIVYYWDSLWCAFAVHTAWNFTQNIVFGLPNSGMMVPFSLFKLNVATARDSFFYNVAFGVEGTVFAVLIDAAACVLVWLLGRKHGAKGTDIWTDKTDEPLALPTAE